MKSPVLFLVVVVVVLLASLTGIQSVTLPSSIQKCARSDPQFLECWRKSFENGFRVFADGYPSLGLYKLEPFRIEKLDLGDSNAGSVKLNQKYQNVDIYGISKSSIVELDSKLDGPNPYLNLNVFSPLIHLVSDYDIKGQILVFPINGHGRCNNTMYELTALHKIKLTKETKKGKKHFKIIDYTVDMIPKRVYFDYDNLFPGNAELSAEITKTINDNGLAVFGDVKDGFAKAFAEVYKQTANNFFAKVSEDDLFLD